jgi:hypothetical protein
MEQLEPSEMGCSLASLARLFHLAAIRPDKSRGQGFLQAGTYGVIDGAVNCGVEKVPHGGSPRLAGASRQPASLILRADAQSTCISGSLHQ